ncbi:MAG: alpha/beta fold hydrolase [Nodosilinea sp.]
MAETRYHTWNTYRCAYDHDPGTDGSTPPLLLIHPIGVGLAGWFWQRFRQAVRHQGWTNPIYIPDLLGCGASDKPTVAYTPGDWASQLDDLIRHVIQRPVVVVAQGATLPIVLKLVERSNGEPWIQSLVLSGPPGWALVTSRPNPTGQRLLWNLLFSGPAGAAFFRYARREAFLRSFSRRQLFDSAAAIDRKWLDQLQADASDAAGRYAVFSFLAGFWREDYTEAIEALHIPTLVLFGEAASGIDRLSRADAAQKRLNDYLEHLPQGTGKIIAGRNVLPYESTQAFVAAMERGHCNHPEGA